MSVESSDWSLRLFDHVEVHASDYQEGVHARAKDQVDEFYRAGTEAGFRSNGAPGYRDYGPGCYAAYLLDPDGNNVEALYRDVGNVGHGAGANLR